mmetsp:Transcript_67743/g.83033  ORF Transcript_67743/g.83033 Transcript_67743/m.83033 type:complete len:212 (-) Transcript_67743:38-673(-)
MSTKKRKVPENGLEIPPKKKPKTNKYDRIKMIYNHDSNIELESYNEWNILFDTLKQFFNSDGIIYNITSNKIIKLLTEYAVGYFNTCEKCEKDVLTLQNDLNENGKFQFFNDGDITEFICNECDKPCNCVKVFEDQSMMRYICYGNKLAKHSKRYLCLYCGDICENDYCNTVMCYECYGECNKCGKPTCNQCIENCDVCNQNICNICSNNH